MKKHFFKYTTFLSILLTGVLPIVTSAQSDKEHYLRPSYWRPYDQRGINVFETNKIADTIPFEGPRIRFGAGFTQQFQNLKHENTAFNNQTSNKLYPITPGFMTAQANLFTDIQLADGIRLNVTTYLSTRHHNEAWVKGGYIQFDKLPFKGKFWKDLMDVATIRVGHMEINYGDAHFRRSDAGQTIYNPFMESYIMDAFSTEIGGEVYLQKNGLFGMLGVTNGMIKGNIDSAAQGTIMVNGVPKVVDENTKRAPSIYVKGGIDKQLAANIRVRVSGSYYHNSSNAGSGLTMYSGDRSGSNYQNVVEKWKATDGAVNASTVIAFSGRLNPGFSKKIDAVMLNGFLKVSGLELFGTYETSKGRTKTETADRTASQLAGDVVYRFGNAENLFAGLRYNTVKAQLAGITNDVKVNRFALAGGWFVTRNVLMKAEYVVQKYNNFPTTDYRNGGKFNGYVIEAVVGF
ncbi:hypothetical protein [Segetibacter sp.]|jgi:hypothetical protein|uniref:hypothetical protein n=1 Tax=Segetibacter sp. TaxID=2231182 RepID=UPI002606642B|nr:hypothetical protein [Segetibacter sp.]MCW3080539.1 hypothetical protein [Segetibacter sp.]